MTNSINYRHVLASATMLLAIFAPQSKAQPAARPGFVTTAGTHFVLDGQPFYFQGTNAANFAIMDGRSEADVYSAMQQYAAHGLRVVRFWGFSCKGAFYGQPMIERVDAKGVHYNEDALMRLDATLDAARAAGLKVIMPLVNFEPEYCGINWWVKSITGSDDKQQFYKDERVSRVYKRHVATLLNRVNTRYQSTIGKSIRYADDPTFLSIEVMNEPHTQDGYDYSGILVNRYLDDMSTYIRSIDPNHLISSGEEGYKTTIDPKLDSYDHAWISNGLKGVNFEADIWLKNIDFMTTHTYPDNNDIQSWDMPWVVQNLVHRRADLAHWAGKPIVMEESGFSNDPNFHGSLGYYSNPSYWLRQLYDAANAADFAGTLIWQVFPSGWKTGGYDYSLDDSVGQVVTDQARFMNSRR